MARMRLMVNGAPYECEGDASVPAVLAAMGANPQSVAVLVNEEVVRLEQRPEFVLHEGDRVEVLTFAGGG
jgi:sulfur carrier protein